MGIRDEIILTWGVLSTISQLSLLYDVPLCLVSSVKTQRPTVWDDPWSIKIWPVSPHSSTFHQGVLGVGSKTDWGRLFLWFTYFFGKWFGYIVKGKQPVYSLKHPLIQHIWKCFQLRQDWEPRGLKRWYKKHWRKVPVAGSDLMSVLAQMLHGAGIFTYIYPRNDPVL